MAYFLIQGARALSGTISVAGAKNAALKILPAALLTEEPTHIERIPWTEDIRRSFSLLEALGARVEIDEAQHRATIYPEQVQGTDLTAGAASKIRGALLYLAPLIARFGHCSLSVVGGCDIGARPIDFFIKGFQALGAEVVEKDGIITFTAKHLTGGNYCFPVPSHTGTETLLMASVFAHGTTILENASQEPEVGALATYLNSCGAKIQGIGTHTLRIEGVSKMHGGVYTIMPDRLETGTFAILAAATRSHIEITDCTPEHLNCLWTHFETMGIPFKRGSTTIEIFPWQRRPKGISIRTEQYPGFATDLQPPFTILLTQSEGVHLVHETVWEGRLLYVDKLNRMGAHIILCDPHRAVVQGYTPLYGKHLESPDIRAGIALIIAGLAAEGQTRIDNIYQIDRGYDSIDQRLQKLGAQIERIDRES